MKRKSVFRGCLFTLGCIAVIGYAVWWLVTHDIVTRTEYHETPPRDDLNLVDDVLEDKNPAFDEDLVDSRPLGDWWVNASAAVIRLDCPAIKPDVEPDLLDLHASYTQAAEAAKRHGHQLLPSANMLDGAAKQFDDGLYAALDLACYRGALGLSPAPADLVEAIFEQSPPGSPARPFLAAALKLAGREVALEPEEQEVRDRHLADFRRDEARSKPIAFYTWTPELETVWRFSRFLQFQFTEDDLATPRAIAAVLAEHANLLEDYRTINGFYGRLTNPLVCLPVDALIGTDEGLKALAARLGAHNSAVALFPPSTSRENELFGQVFTDFLPPEADLMLELIRAIRSGEVDLTPKDEDGWYQYQVYALETMLVPSKGQESEKLLLTAKYKKRLVDAFKALVTKRRETHARQLELRESPATAFAEHSVSPRLRVEPCATFYLRTARAYAFLENFLTAAVGVERLEALRGLKKGGERGTDLASELAAMRQRFYGFYLVACEDIGMRPNFLEDEPVDVDAAKQAALTWLDAYESDADLACDTRVAIPIFIDPIRKVTRLWATLGVRLAPLEASYARPPMVRLKGEAGPWQDVEPYQLGPSNYVIPVDEFGEFELAGSAALTRDELRTICDKYKTKEAILKALE